MPNHQPTQRIHILGILQGGTPIARLEHALAGFLVSAFCDVIKENRLRNLKPQLRTAAEQGVAVERRVLDEVVDEILRQIESVQRDEIAGTSLAKVDFEQLVLAVAFVVLHVEIGHALVFDVLEEALIRRNTPSL